MKIFNKNAKTVSSILSAFTTTVQELENLAVAQNTNIDTFRQVIQSTEEKIKVAESEAKQAETIAAKLKELLAA